jgi:hypothetical protein
LSKRQANFKDVMQFGAFKRLVEQKKKTFYLAIYTPGLWLVTKEKHKNNRARAKKVWETLIYPIALPD